MSETHKADLVEIGFIEKAESSKLCSKYFPCKVGGFPAWLGLDSLPKEEELQCKKCQKPLAFLCQLYAPITSYENCFHRTVFVFICRDGQCSSENDASNIRVFRSQLPRSNKYYSYDPPKDDDDDSPENPLASDYVKLCRICGCFGPKVCGGCKKVTYCSKYHQAMDWKAAHKVECRNKESDTSVVTRPNNNFLFPEYEIDMEPEELENTCEKSEEQVLQEYEDLLKTGQQPTFDADDEESGKDMLKMAVKDTDRQFARFRTRIKEYPNQVIRYDRGGEPLWVSSENKPKSIPPCEHCGKERQFEFQIMPQLLLHLKVDSLGPSIDWGTVLIFSCADNCTQDKLYLEEVAYKQDYSPNLDFLRQ